MLKVEHNQRTFILPPPLALTLSWGGWCNFAPPAAFSILHIENIFREPQ